MKKVNHNNLPKAVELLLKEIFVIKEALADGKPMNLKINHDDRIYNKSQAADLFGVSRSTMNRIINEGEIPYSRIGKQYRFLHRDLIKWLESTGRSKWPSYNKAIENLKK